MSQGEPIDYRVDFVRRIKGQIDAIAAQARNQGKLNEFLATSKAVIDRLRRDPQGWGDPKYRTPSGTGMVYSGIARPIAIDYVVYEQDHAVILLTVRLFADFA